VKLNIKTFDRSVRPAYLSNSFFAAALVSCSMCPVSGYSCCLLKKNGYNPTKSQRQAANSNFQPKK